MPRRSRTCRQCHVTASPFDAFLPYAEAAQLQGPAQESLLPAVFTSASALLAAVLRSLASPFGIGRVHKASLGLCQLHMLAAQQQSPQQASAWLQGLLAGALGSLQQSGHVTHDAAQRL